MLDFNFCVPTQFLFGAGSHKKCGEAIKARGGSKVLLVHDGSPFLKTVLDEAVTALKEQNLEVFELDGVVPNPLLSRVYDGINICRENGVDFLLALGGGSVIDTTKAIAAGVPYEGDVWDYYTTHAPVLKALPLGVILTIPATGSESGAGTVITKEEGHLKRGAGGPALFPAFACMNPEITFTLPTYQTAVGIADMYTHNAERYFSPTPDTYIMDALAEGIFRTLHEVAPKVMAEPNNYDYRAEIMWVGTVAHNDTAGVGRAQDWSTHDIGHEIGGRFNCTHGNIMAIILCSWMRYVYKHDICRFVRYARYGCNLDIDGMTDEEAAIAGIEATEHLMFDVLGLKRTLKELGVDPAAFEEMADLAIADSAPKRKHPVGTVGGFMELRKPDVIKIMELAY